MSDSQNRAFDLAISCVAAESNALSTEVLDLLREAILEGWSPQQIADRCLATADAN